jgi:hypothetical protein
MPGINVLIKGLNKVVNFPENTSMETIERSIKGGWDQVESMSGLPMDAASKLEREKYLGWNPNDDVYFHSSHNEKITEIHEGDRFGGVFALPGYSAEYGDIVTKFKVKPEDIAEDSDISKYIQENAEEVLDMAPWLRDRIESVDDLEDWVGRFENIPDDVVTDSYADLQRLRGQIAKASGFSATRIDDEFEGDTVMLLGGKGVRSIDAEFNPVNRNSGNLLGSLAGGAVGVGALSQSGESEAAQSSNRLLQEGLIDQKSKAFNTPSPALNKLGLWLQRGPQSLVAEGVGRGIETLSLGRENELTDEEIRKRAIGVGLDFL